MAASDQEKVVGVAPQAISVVGFGTTTGKQRAEGDRSFTGDPVALFDIGRAQRQLPARNATGHRHQGQSPQLPSPETRASLRLNWLAARVAAAAMVEAAAAKDMPALTVAADDLDQSLSKLWKLRSGRDLDWQTILNHTQDVMRQFFARKLVEELTAEQCRRIASIVDDYLGPATKSVDDLNEVLRLIEDAEFDPYAAISGDASDDCQMGS